MNDKIKIVLLNGPPGCGKDTIAMGLLRDELFRASYPVHFTRFSSPLKSALASFFGVSIDDLGNTRLEERKNEPALWNGVSYREAQIKLSELYAKPLFGLDIFGRLFIERVYNGYARAIKNEVITQDDVLVVLVPDSGFVVEAEPVVAEFGARNVALFNIYREGHSFEGDSRSYLSLDHLGVNRVRLINDGTIEDFLTVARKEVMKWLSTARRS